MSIKRLMFLAGICLVFSGCSSGRYPDEAQFTGAPSNKGVRYLLGRGVPQSDSKAFYYFKQAANEDDPFAQNEVAYMYAAGKGTPRNYRQALMYYKKAAEHGLASAQYNLGLMYANGLGTDPSQSMADSWFKRAAANGFEPARLALNRS